MLPRLINPRQIQKHMFCVVLTVLCIVNIFLFLYIWNIRLQYGDDVVKTLFLKRSAEIEETFKFDELWLDRTGRYIINQNVNKKFKKINRYTVTILTHCTLSNLIYLPQMLKNWDGPVSVAVFIDTFDDFTLILKAFAICNVDVVHSVNFQVVRPLERSLLNNTYLLQELRLRGLFDNPSLLCQKFNILLYNLNRVRSNYDSSVFYPGNLLRNVAKVSSVTKYILNLDIDMVPSKDLHKSFSSFAISLRGNSLQNENTAYILPAFEVDPSFVKLDRVFPVDKNLLLNFVSQGFARPFYSAICDHCQNRTNYLKWMSLKNFSTYKSTMNIAYGVNWSHGYEPFFIAPRESVPRFDEHFKQYGYNRVSQLCEMHVVGWKLQVLDSAFVVHIGFKTDDSSFHNSKNKEMGLNWKLYREFRKRIELKYPDSVRNCDIPPIYKL